MPEALHCRLAIIGGGPAGLMAAETARAAGVEVDVFDAMGSVGRKFLVAGKGGLNLTHSDDFETFVSRYRGREAAVRRWLRPEARNVVVASPARPRRPVAGRS